MDYKYKIPYPKFGKKNVENIFNSNKLNKSQNITNKITKVSNKITNKAKEIGQKITSIEISKPKYPIFYVLLLIIILVLIFLIIFFGYYIFTECYDKKNLSQYILDFDFDPCKSKFKPSSLKERKIEDEKEVFHISNQDFTYEQAKCKCAAYGGRLATKNEIIEAYNNGAEWCTYGWSEGQRAYYITQKCSWDKRQEEDPRHRFDCGWPGLNGGFFANPKLKFGINCYGIRPKGKLIKEKLPICEGRQFCKIKNNYNASHRLDTDIISPFNKNQWSRYG